jgi:hypothetical protein
MDYSVKNQSSLLRDEREGCRSLVCDANGIIIAEMVYRCMICSTVSESISDAKLHYHNNHIDTDIPEVPVPPPSILAAATSSSHASSHQSTSSNNTTNNNPRSLISTNNNSSSNNNHSRITDNGSSSSSSLLASSLEQLRVQQQQRLAQIQARHLQESMVFPDDDYSMELPESDDDDQGPPPPPVSSRSIQQQSTSNKHSSSIRFNSSNKREPNVVHVDPMNLSMTIKTSPSSLHSNDNNNSSMTDYADQFNVSPKRISCKNLSAFFLFVWNS